jgi:hypothetical protein
MCLDCLCAGVQGIIFGCPLTLWKDLANTTRAQGRLRKKEGICSRTCYCASSYICCDVLWFPCTDWQSASSQLIILFYPILSKCQISMKSSLKWTEILWLIILLIMMVMMMTQNLLKLILLVAMDGSVLPWPFSPVLLVIFFLFLLLFCADFLSVFKILIQFVIW